MYNNKMNDITRGLIYTAITSDIGELWDTDNGGACFFGDIEVKFTDENTRHLTIEDILCITTMQEVAESVYKHICDLDIDIQKQILEYINDRL